MKIPFAKTEAHGNDFLLVSHPRVSALEPSSLARAICDRHRGIGSDGLILYRAEEREFAMTLFNSDGSRAEISGNGVRCLAAYLVYRGLASGDSLEILTGAGKVALDRWERDENRFRFRANMGRPRSFEKGVRLELDPPDPDETLDATLEATIVSMGNPHAVVFTESCDRSRLVRLGPRIEQHPRFPDGTNVELVQVVGSSGIHMAVWERGAGETASSGTGASAAAVASILSGTVKSPVSVTCAGGELLVEWKEGGELFLTGDAVILAEGDYLAAPA